MADALDSKSSDGNIMRVQLPPPAPSIKTSQIRNVTNVSRVFMNNQLSTLCPFALVCAFLESSFRGFQKEA